MSPPFLFMCPMLAPRFRRAALMVTIALVAPLLCADSVAASGRCRTIEVVDAHGRPLPGAGITLWDRPDIEGEPISGRSWQTDRRGRACEPGLLQGGYLEVEAPERDGGRCAARSQIRLHQWTHEAASPPSVRVVLDVKPVPRSRLTGRILSADRRPLEGAIVEINSVSVPEGGGNECDVPQGQSARSRSDGTFSFASIPRGRSHLRVTHHDFSRRDVDVPSSGGPLDILLDPGALWTGHVLYPDGAEITRCELRLSRHDWEQRAVCSPAGFRFEHLPSGDMELEVHLDSDRELGTRTLRRKVRVNSIDHRQDDIAWPAGRSIAGELVRQDGQPVRGAVLLAVPKGESDIHPNRVVIRTDSSGRFTFRHLALGAWTLVYANPRETRLDVPDGTSDVRMIVQGDHP